ncbi:MAG: hypothetical protein KKC46_19595 [Proteobacteria bacterium]|nr:hypothetical protein [Pseudomonadota bacterium]
MYLYWRIQQDLDCMGEVLQFHDPSFIRCFRQWVSRNSAGIALAEDMDYQQFYWPCLN